MAEEMGIDSPGFAVRLLDDAAGECANINLFGYKYEAFRAGTYHRVHVR